MFNSGLRWTRWWSLGIIMLCSSFFWTAGCSSPPKQVLPQVGSRAVPEIFLADRPTFTPLTQDEFDKIPITASGKILKNQSDWQAYGDIADAAIQGYRGYIQSLFDKDAAPGVPPPTAPAKKGWYQFWK